MAGSNAKSDQASTFYDKDLFDAFKLATVKAYAQHQGFVWNQPHELRAWFYADDRSSRMIDWVLADKYVELDENKSGTTLPKGAATDGDRDGARMDPETTVLPYHRWLNELLAITKRAVPDTDKTENPFRAPVTEHDPKFFLNGTFVEICSLLFRAVKEDPTPWRTAVHNWRKEVEVSLNFTNAMSVFAHHNGIPSDEMYTLTLSQQDMIYYELLSLPNYIAELAVLGRDALIRAWEKVFLPMLRLLVGRQHAQKVRLDMNRQYAAVTKHSVEEARNVRDKVLQYIRSYHLYLQGRTDRHLTLNQNDPRTGALHTFMRHDLERRTEKAGTREALQGMKQYAQQHIADMGTPVPLDQTGLFSIGDGDALLDPLPNTPAATPAVTPPATRTPGADTSARGTGRGGGGGRGRSKRGRGTH